MDMQEQRKVIINMICPSVSLSKVVQFMGWEDERIDLGSISRTFGLDPLTIKMNGHFISRGVDYVASSVTWKSMLSFFSARGLSTGIFASEPLRVDGKLCKVGTKRAHDREGEENTIYCMGEWGNKQPLGKDLNFFKKSRFKGPDYIAEEDKFTKCEGVGLKREHNLDVNSPLKKSQGYKSNLESYVSSEYAVEDNKISKCYESGLKRKNQPDAVQPQKKMRMHETNLGLGEKENALSGF